MRNRIRLRQKTRYIDDQWRNLHRRAASSSAGSCPTCETIPSGLRRSLGQGWLLRLTQTARRPAACAPCTSNSTWSPTCNVCRARAPPAVTAASNILCAGFAAPAVRAVTIRETGRRCRSFKVRVAVRHCDQYVIFAQCRQRRAHFGKYVHVVAHVSSYSHRVVD